MNIYEWIMLISVNTSLVITIILFLNSAYIKGKIGEIKVRKILNQTKYEHQNIINNLTIKDNEGRTGQIDHILINKHGVFVIETKNYSGSIYGLRKNREWNQYFKGYRKPIKFPNPIWQNQGHIYRLKAILGEDLPYFSIIVFIKNNAKKVNEPNVIGLCELRNYLDSFSDQLLSEQDIENINQKLLPYKKHAFILTIEHLKRIETMKNNINNDICPRCNAPLVKKDGPFGPFIACENYPTCRFVKGNYAENKETTEELPIINQTPMEEMPIVLFQEPPAITPAQTSPKLTCTICGCTELTKKDDFIVCDQCGCKYTIEDARNLIVLEIPSQPPQLDEPVPTEVTLTEAPTTKAKKGKGSLTFLLLFLIGLILTVVCFTQPLPEIRENGYIFKMKDDGTYLVHSYTKNESEITVPSSVRGRAVTEIGGMAFKDNHNIKTLIIPEGITTIGSAAFLNCNSIETLVVPFLGKNAGSAGYLNYFFSSSIGKRLDGTSVPDSLKNVYLLDTCTQLGDCAFIQCKNLKKVYIPSSVKIIDDGTGGTVIGVNGNTSTYYDKFPFYGCSEDLTIYCESYSKDTQWDEYWNYINYAYSLEVHWGSKLYSSPYYVSDGYYVTEAIDHSIPQTVALNMSNYKTYLNLAYKVTPQNYTNNVFNPGYHELKVEINVENASDDLTFQDVELTVYFEVTYKEKELKSVYTKTTSQTRAKTFTIKIGNSGSATAKTAFYTSDNGVIEDISSTICELHDITGTVIFYP